MTGLDGINSLKTALGGLTDTAPVTATQGKGKAGGEFAAALTGGDRASFSVAGGLAAQATDTSDVRLTKVAELRQAIASGTYKVPAYSVADKMVDGLLG